MYDIDKKFKIANLDPIPRDRITTHQGDVVRLDYVDQNKRIERQTGFMGPILPQNLDSALDAGAFVCVPITDYEAGLDTLKYIKEHNKGIILLDAHGPTNTLFRTGQRFFCDAEAPKGNLLVETNSRQTACTGGTRKTKHHCAFTGPLK